MQPSRGSVAVGCCSMKGIYFLITTVLVVRCSIAIATQATCSCDCCEAELQNDAPDEESRFECVRSQPMLFAGQAPVDRCPEQCQRSPADLVLSAAEDEDVDTERFCFFECAPKPSHKDGPYAGDSCRPLAPVEEKAVVDDTGNAVPPMAQLPVMSNFLVHRRSLSQNGLYAGASPAPAAGPAGAKPTADAWASVAGRAPEESARITELGQTAAKKQKEAADTSGASIDKIANKASDALPIALAAVEDARRAAGEARRHEKIIRTMRDNALLMARREALGLVPAILRKIEKEWHKKAKKWAKKQAAAMQKRMIVDAPIAAEAAAAPYAIAQRNAEALATEYSRRGNFLTAQSTSLQARATQLRDEANRLRLSNLARAQQLMKKATDTQQKAQEAEDQAGSFFTSAQSIKDVTIPQFSRDAAQTARHAEVMVNPDAPKPLPPLDAPLQLSPII